MRATALLLALVLLSPLAFAGDGQVVLRFKDGRLLPGKVLEVTDRGVKHQSDQGVAFWPWDTITTYGQYEARAAVVAEDDGAGRLALARWTLEAGLPGRRGRSSSGRAAWGPVRRRSSTASSRGATGIRPGGPSPRPIAGSRPGISTGPCRCSTPT
jgi:hypothetical protein